MSGRTPDTAGTPNILPYLRTWSHPALSTLAPGAVVVYGDSSSRNPWKGIGVTCLAVGKEVCQQPPHKLSHRHPALSDTEARETPRKGTRDQSCGPGYSTPSDPSSLLSYYRQNMNAAELAGLKSTERLCNHLPNAKEVP